MLNILKDFANGEINPNEQFLMDRDGEWIQNLSGYHKEVERLTEVDERLREALDRENLKLYEELRNAQHEVEYLTETYKFVQGYRLGALMMMEVLLGAEEIFGSKWE